MRLVGEQKFEGRGHFFAAAAEAMRRILVNHAWDLKRLKRGGVDDAIQRLAQEYPDAAEIVKLRFFAGMTLAEAAETLGLSRRTADRQWSFARAWLACALGSPD